MFIDFSQVSLYWSVTLILFNPTFWNIAARAEYKYHILTKIARRNPYHGCYALALMIFFLGIIRDYIFTEALNNQPTHPFLDGGIIRVLAAVLFVVGNTLVLSSMWALGVTGTYLGDYFGILMKERVTGFPFNVCDNPMYNGSTCNFLAAALWNSSPAGVLLTCLVYFAYEVALKYEEPFTAEIYQRNKAASTRSSQ